MANTIRKIALMAATTMATVPASYTHFLCRVRPEADKCQLLTDDPCATLHPYAELRHIQFPLVVGLCVAVFVHTPTLLLASHRKVLHVQAALARVALLLAGALASLSDVAPTLAYALSLHGTAALLLTEPLYPPIVGVCVERTARHLGVACVCLYAWYAGPPLHVVDHPCASGYCGLRMHMLGSLFADVLLPAAVRAVDSLATVQL